MNFFDSFISPEAVELVTETLRSGFVSEGCRVKEFEAAMANELGLRNGVAVNSGTAALHLGLAVAGVGPGDEVLLPAQTFVASGLSILMQGAKPVFVDIDYKTGNIDPNELMGRATERTRAVMPVHWAGLPCEMEAILQTAREQGWTVIEDAAHALGAEYRARPVGTLSPFTAFSFQAIKHLTTGDGGMLCCSQHEDYRRARAQRWFGIDRERSKPSVLGERQFDIEEVGFKYHMNDIAASIGLGNLKGFCGRLEQRRRLNRVYRDRLNGTAGVQLLESPDDRKSACWLFTALFESRNELIEKLVEHEVPVSVVHQGIDKNSVFGGIDDELTNQRRFDAHQLSLPLHPGMSEEAVLGICELINQGWG